MVYTVGEMAKLLGVAASTLRYYDKEGLLPFVERSSGGIRMFRESDIEWLQVIGCMKKAGMSIKDIRQYIEMALQGDDTIDLRLAMFQRQQEVLKQQMAELRHTMEMVDYKCWYYETAKEAGTVDAPQKMELAKVPERFRKIRQELRTAPGTAATIRQDCLGNGSQALDYHGNFIVQKVLLTNDRPGYPLFAEEQESSCRRDGTFSTRRIAESPRKPESARDGSGQNRHP